MDTILFSLFINSCWSTNKEYNMYYFGIIGCEGGRIILFYFSFSRSLVMGVPKGPTVYAPSLIPMSKWRLQTSVPQRTVGNSWSTILFMVPFTKNIMFRKKFLHIYILFIYCESNLRTFSLL